ncbi:hypothetical protein HYX08_05965 [Candidatus Woesearchaeota archaeon]|nr:hypothetical protein [Candidatus Woesearchaeota archaeon]
MSKIPFDPSVLTGLSLKVNVEVPVGKEVTIKLKEDGIEHVVKAQVRWIAGMRNATGELLKKEFDSSGQVVERVLGPGNLEDYFSNTEGFPYMMGVQCFPSKYGVNFPELG